VFRERFCIRCLMYFRIVVCRLPCEIPSLFGSARKRLTCENRNTFYTKTSFFKVRSCAGAAGKAKNKRKINTEKPLHKYRKYRCFLTFFLAGRPCRTKTPKMTSQSPFGTHPGTPPEGEIDQLFAPRDPPGREQQFLGRPGPPQSPSRRPPERLPKQASRPRVPQGPPGSHFGAILTPCWPLPAFIFKLLSCRLGCACGFFCATFGAACPLLSHVVLNAFRTTCANKGARQHTQENAKKEQEPAKARTAPTQANHRMSRTCKTLHTPTKAIQTTAGNETPGTKGGRR